MNGVDLHQIITKNADEVICVIYRLVLFFILKIFLILLYILFLIESLLSNKTSYTTFHSSWPWIWTGDIEVAFVHW